MDVWEEGNGCVEKYWMYRAEVMGVWGGGSGCMGRG